MDLGSFSKAPSLQEKINVNEIDINIDVNVTDKIIESVDSLIFPDIVLKNISKNGDDFKLYDKTTAAGKMKSV